VFVELPVEEAFASLSNSIKRSGAIIFADLVLAFLPGLFLARRMVGRRACDFGTPGGSRRALMAAAWRRARG
jgi:hypothetical protein